MSAPALHEISGLDDFTDDRQEIDFGDFKNEALGRAIAPPVPLALAREWAGGSDKLLTPGLVRGVPAVHLAPKQNGDAQVDRGQEVHSLLVDRDGREYPNVDGDPRLLRLVRRHLVEILGMPEPFGLTITGGGRSAIGLIVEVMPQDAEYLLPKLAYSAVPAEISIIGRGITSVPVDLQNFNIDQYYNDVIEGAKRLKASGKKHVVYMDTIPGNPLGVTYKDQAKRLKFLDELRELGVMVVIDGFYSTYENPESDNFPNNVFRGVDDMRGRLFLGGATKDGPFPYPGLRAAWIAGDPKVVGNIKKVQSGREGGVAAPSQQILFNRLSLEFDGEDGPRSADYQYHLLRFAKHVERVRVMARARLEKMGFKVYGGVEEGGIGTAGMYLLAEVPEDTPDVVSGYKDWAQKAQIVPGLPGATCNVDAHERPGESDFLGAETSERVKFRNLVRVCIGAGEEQVGRELTAMEERIHLVRR